MRFRTTNLDMLCLSLYSGVRDEAVWASRRHVRKLLSVQMGAHEGAAASKSQKTTFAKKKTL